MNRSFIRFYVWVILLLFIGSCRLDIDSSTLSEQSWISKINEDLTQREYNISSIDEVSRAFQSPNRAQKLRAYYSKEGFILSPRFQSDCSWEINFQLDNFSRKHGESIQIGTIKNQHQSLQQLIFDYENDISVEYLNSPSGVRQNFYVHKSPEGSGYLSVNMEIKTNLIPQNLHESEIRFSERLANGEFLPKLNYQDLKVWDADGKKLEAWMEIVPQSNANEYLLALNVNDEDANYPILIDPLSTTPDATLESNQMDARLGISVSTAGDVNGDGYSDVIVGANLYDNGQVDEGAAFVYHGSASGLSTTPAITLEMNQASSQMGASVSLAGDVNGDEYDDVIVGAPSYDNGQTDEGAAFVYLGSASGISGTPSVQLENNQASSNMGIAVSTAGDIDGDDYSDVLVGAHLYDNGTADEGVVFVYYGSASGITTTVGATLEENQASSGYGLSVGAAGDINGDGFSDILVGAPLYDNGTADEGAAFLYLGAAIGINTTAHALLEANQGNAAYGTSVFSGGDLNGDGYSDIVVSAPNFTNGESNEGAVFLYNGTSGGINTTPLAQLESNQIDANMGSHAASLGDANGDGFADIIVGVPGYTNGETDEGAAFVYYGQTSGIGSSPDIFESNQANAFQGIWVSAAGDVNGDGFADALVGADQYDNGQSDEGAVFVFHGSSEGVSTTASFVGEANSTADQMGTTVNHAGDVNGDGFDDIVVGLGYFDGGQSNEGAGFVYHGSASGLSSTPDAQLESNFAGARMGYLAGAGDVNGDGYSDIIAGAPFLTNGLTEEGKMFIFHGSASGISTTPATEFEPNIALLRFGFSVSSAGDINADGYSDVIASGYKYTNGQSEEGGVFVFYGSPTGVVTSTYDILESNSANARMGINVGAAGDINGDGYSDIVAGGHNYTNGQTQEGAFFVFLGSSGGIISTPDIIVESNQANARLGINLSTAGDVNGDGYSDLIVGAFAYDNGESDEGAAFIYHGSAGGLVTPAAAVLESNQMDAFAGRAVSTAGDVNGDGYSDVIVGANGYDNGTTDEGAAFLYFGSPSGINTTVQAILENNQASSDFGQTVGHAGDVNNDGYSDVVVGSRLFDNGNLSEGAAFVFHGNSSTTLSQASRQYYADLTTPLQPNSGNGNETQVGIGQIARSPLSRASCKLVWEVASEGTAFSGSPINTSTASTSESLVWTDTGVGGSEIKESVNKLTGVRTRIRARIKYHAANRITGQPLGKWTYFGGSTSDGIGTILPVELLELTATELPNNQVDIFWQTASEEEVSIFQLERSIDQSNWESVYETPGMGAPNMGASYNHLDEPPISKIVYYRLNYIDIDGTTYYLKQVSVLLSPGMSAGVSALEPLKINAYPNPWKGDQLYLSIDQPLNGRIFDHQGRLVREFARLSPNGQGIVPISGLSALPQGTYFLQVFSEQQSQTIKLLKYQ